MKPSTRRAHVLATILIAAASLVYGCKKDEPPAAPAPTLSPMQLEAKLAQADAYDGTKDKTISKCFMCGLGMKGDAAHSYMYLGYTLHFCSNECRAAFAKDSAAVVAKAELPSP